MSSRSVYLSPHCVCLSARLAAMSTLVKQESISSALSDTKIVNIQSLVKRDRLPVKGRLRRGRVEDVLHGRGRVRVTCDRLGELEEKIRVRRLVHHVQSELVVELACAKASGGSASKCRGRWQAGQAKRPQLQERNYSTYHLQRGTACSQQREWRARRRAGGRRRGRRSTIRRAPLRRRASWLPS